VIAGLPARQHRICAVAVNSDVRAEFCRREDPFENLMVFCIVAPAQATNGCLATSSSEKDLLRTSGFPGAIATPNE
jgi:hypothetical protein